MYTGISGNGPLKYTVRVYLSYSGDKPASQIALAVTSPDWVQAVPAKISIEKIIPNTTPTLLKLTFYALNNVIPTSLDVTLHATYCSGTGDTRVTSLGFMLPLYLACRIRPPSKNAQYKLTIDTDAAAMALTDLFDDFLNVTQVMGVEVSEVLGKTGANAMGLQFWTNKPLGESDATGALVSILVSKQAGRYRIQSDNLMALYIVADELEKKLIVRLKELNVAVDSNGIHSLTHSLTHLLTHSLTLTHSQEYILRVKIRCMWTSYTAAYPSITQPVKASRRS